MTEIRLIAGYGSMVALEDYEAVESALREAEAQRDAWREEGYLMVERVNADHKRAETAERERDVARQAHDDADAALQSLMAKYDPKVAEYRQALEPFAGGGHAYGYDDCKWCVAAKVLARDAPPSADSSLREEQPRQGCIDTPYGKVHSWPTYGPTDLQGNPVRCEECNAPYPVAEPEREGTE